MTLQSLLQVNSIFVLQIICWPVLWKVPNLCYNTLCFHFFSAIQPKMIRQHLLWNFVFFAEEYLIFIQNTCNPMSFQDKMMLKTHACKSVVFTFMFVILVLYPLFYDIVQIYIYINTFKSIYCLLLHHSNACVIYII